MNGFWDFRKGPFSCNFGPFWTQIPKFGPKQIFPEKLGSVTFMRLPTISDVNAMQ